MSIHRGVEQLAARWAHNPKVGGSSPPPATTLKLAIKANFFNVLFQKNYTILTFGIIKYKIKNASRT